jgi:hypothetical protein
MFKVRSIKLAFVLLCLLILALISIFSSYSAIILLCFFMALGGTFFWFVFQENKSLFSRLPALVARKHAITSLVQYCPLLAVLVFGLSLQTYWIFVAKTFLYEEAIVEKNPASAVGEIGYLYDSRSFQDDVEKTLSKRFQKGAADTIETINATANDGLRQAGYRSEQLPNAFIGSFSRDLVDPGRCKRIIRFVCRSINNSYKEKVNEQGQKLRNQLRSDVVAAETTDVQYRASLIKSVGDGYVSAEQNALWWTRIVFNFGTVLNMFSVVFLAGAIFKSLSYIFARNILTATGQSQNFCPKSKRASQAQFDLPKERDSLQLKLIDREKVYISTNLNVLGDFERKAIPLKWSLLLKRVANRKYVLHQISAEHSAEKNVTIDSNIGDQFVEVVLRKDEELFFKIERLAGFSSTVAFNSYLNCRLMGLIFGNLTYSCAVGPGRLLLVVPGGCTIPDGNSDFLQHRLVAWKGTAKFSVSSSTDMKDVYFSGISVSSSVGNTCVVEKSTSRTQRKYISRFFRRFFWPL